MIRWRGGGEEDWEGLEADDDGIGGGWTTTGASTQYSVLLFFVLFSLCDKLTTLSVGIRTALGRLSQRVLAGLWEQLLVRVWVWTGDGGEISEATPDSTATLGTTSRFPLGTVNFTP